MEKEVQRAAAVCRYAEPMAEARGSRTQKGSRCMSFFSFSGVALLAESQVFPMRRVQGQGWKNIG
jgi:hypothetical protein